jgi:hypothetical protein
MAKYLLTCGCGQKLAIEPGQAGERIACPKCAAPLDVPPLRKLRHLPPASVEAVKSRFTWGARQGIATAAFILALVLAAVALWNRFTEPAIPIFDPAARLQAVDDSLEKLTPLQGWQMWVDLYRPLATRGFANLEDPNKRAIEQHIARRRFFQKTLLVAAAVCAAAALAATLWPRQRLAATR